MLENKDAVLLRRARHGFAPQQHLVPDNNKRNNNKDDDDKRENKNDDKYEWKIYW